MALFFIRSVIILLVLVVEVLSYQLDVSDLFSGAKRRPKLGILKLALKRIIHLLIHVVLCYIIVTEIISPENGEVLVTGEVEVRVDIAGFDIPAASHDAMICVGLSSGDNFAEECFDHFPDFVFRVNGLSPGSHYSLRTMLFGKVISEYYSHVLIGALFTVPSHPSYCCIFCDIVL